MVTMLKKREQDEEEREGLYKVWVNDVSCCAASPHVVIMGEGGRERVVF